LGGDNTAPSVLDASEWRISNNVPLIDTARNRARIRENTGCTIKELVEASESGMLGRATYAYSDFMYCKHLGQIPNNYLVTLRRFPTPVDDYISSAGTRPGTRREVESSNPVQMGCMVTWMNTPGNNLEEILTYSVNMPYEQKQAQWEQANTSADNGSGILNGAAALFDSTYRRQYQAGFSGGAINPYVEKLFGGKNLGINPPYSGMFGFRDQNKVYGPVDAVKKIYYRGQDGINFDQNIKLTFEYELRSYDGINGKQAMLDLIANILNVTYTTGTFWGGGYYGGGAHQNNVFANLNIFKANGGFTSFVDAFSKDLSNFRNSATGSTLLGAWRGNADSIQEVIALIKGFLNDLGGMLIGGMLNKLGRPQKAMVNSLLSPAPTGLWHLTIGNPFHPIMSMGNMILKNTTITHTGPLGLDDFPTGLKVVCDLERGKPRDIREIEYMYMNGNDRIYHTMGPKILDMYTHAETYKGEGLTSFLTPDSFSSVISAIEKRNSPTDGNDKSNDGLTAVEVSSETVWDEKTGGVKTAGKTTIKPGYITYDANGNRTVNENLASTLGLSYGSIRGEGAGYNSLNLMKYFGTDDAYPIYVQACEQGYGAWKKQEGTTDNSLQ